MKGLQYISKGLDLDICRQDNDLEQQKSRQLFCKKLLTKIIGDSTLRVESRNRIVEQYNYRSCFGL